MEIKPLLCPLRKGRPFPAPSVVAGIAGRLASVTGVDPRRAFLLATLFALNVGPAITHLPDSVVPVVFT